METDTKNFIADATFKLMKVKNLKEISIKEITDLAGVSRSSFYNNFSNLDDIIDYKINIISKKIFNIYTLNKLRNENLTNFILNLIKYIYSNIDTFVILKEQLFFKLKDNIDLIFYKKITDKERYIIISGIIINIILYWLDNKDTDKLLTYLESISF